VPVVTATNDEEIAELGRLTPFGLITYRFHTPTLPPAPVIAVISVGETTVTAVAGMASSRDPRPGRSPRCRRRQSRFQ